MSSNLASDTPIFSGRAPVELPHPVRLRILGAVMVGIFLAALDQTIVGTALPRIITDLRGNELYTWAITAYLVASTISGPLYGKLGDLFGRRPIFLAGVLIFLAGSLLAGLAQSMPWLVAARGVQGLGAGALFPVALAVIGDIFSPAERGKYQGLFGAVFGVSTLLGPALGGIITDTVGWNWVFMVNLPVGAVVVALIWRYLPAYHLGADKPSIDYLGAALFTGALVPILVGLQNKQSADWTDLGVGGLILVGLAVGAVFVWAESRATEPIVPLGLFRIRSFSISVAAVFLAAFGFLAAVVFLPRWFQVVAGASATESGYLMLPLLGGLIFSAMASGQIVARTGRYRWLILVALLFMSLGLLLLSGLRTATPFPELFAWMFVTGLGVGPTFAVFTLVVQNSVPVERLGTATSNLTFFQQVGGTVGLSITGTLFATTLAGEVPRQIMAADVPDTVKQGFSGSGAFDPNALTGVGDLGAALLASVPEAARAMVEPHIPAIVGAIHEAFSIATAATFGVGIITGLLAAGLVLLLREARQPAVSREQVAGGLALGVPELAVVPLPVESEDAVEHRPAG